MKVVGKVFNRNIKVINELARQSLVETADTLKSDVQQSQTMPFGDDSVFKSTKKYIAGNLQDRSTFVDDSDKNKGKIRIVTDTPYARKMYYHPEYKFYKGHNKNAGGLWFEPYISGKNKCFVSKTFAKIMKGKMK